MCIYIMALGISLVGKGGAYLYFSHHNADKFVLSFILAFIWSFSWLKVVLKNFLQGWQVC